MYPKFKTMTALIILLIVGIAVGAVLIYRNNQKKIEAEASKIGSTVNADLNTIKSDASKVETTATAIVADVKKI